MFSKVGKRAKRSVKAYTTVLVYGSCTRSFARFCTCSSTCSCCTCCVLVVVLVPIRVLVLVLVLVRVILAFVVVLFLVLVFVPVLVPVRVLVLILVFESVLADSGGGGDGRSVDGVPAAVVRSDRRQGGPLEAGAASSRWVFQTQV